MGRFVEGEDRSQSTLLPERLDDYVIEDNPVRVVDAQHHLIVDHQVTNVGHDRSQLAQMAQRARTEMQAEHLEVVADRGYFSGEEIVACEAAGITAYVPRPQTSNNQAQGLFGKRDFVYVPATDTYRCPAGQSLIWRYTTVAHGQTLHCY
ncbi:transposase IS4 family protein, partial [mine drainage metagenome]